MRIVVIGAGVGGMAVAIRLAKAGHAVTVVEQGERIGGKLNLWEPEVPGAGLFRFDTGPHVLTMPWAIREFFEDVGERMEDYLSLERVDPICRYHLADGTVFDAPADPDVASQRIEESFPGNGRGFRTLLAYAKRVHDVTVEPFLRQDFSQAVRGIPTPRQWRQLLDFLRLQPWRTLHELAEKHLTDARLRQIFDLYAFYNGSSPYEASCIFAIIAWVQWGEGTFYIRGGLRTYASALETLARKFGVTIQTGTPVQTILIEGPPSRGRATGVCTAEGTRIAADCVVCNADPLTAYQRLVPEPHRPKTYSEAALQSIAPSTSAFVLLLGVRGDAKTDFACLSHYNSFLPNDLSAEINSIFVQGVPAEDPVIGVTCQSVTDPTAAPEGYTNLFVMTSPPALGNFLWGDRATRDYRDRVLSLLEARSGLRDLRGRIVCEQIWTPQTFAERYGAWRGSLYGVASNGLKSGFLRPPNQARGVQGLYFVGGGTHPGGGLPLVTLSGKIVAESILRQKNTPDPL